MQSSQDRIIIFTSRGKFVNGILTTEKKRKTKKIVILQNFNDNDIEVLSNSKKNATSKQKKNANMNFQE